MPKVSFQDQRAKVLCTQGGETALVQTCLEQSWYTAGELGEVTTLMVVGQQIIYAYLLIQNTLYLFKAASKACTSMELNIKIQSEVHMTTMFPVRSALWRVDRLLSWFLQRLHALNTGPKSTRDISCLSITPINAQCSNVLTKDRSRCPEVMQILMVLCSIMLKLTVILDYPALPTITIKKSTVLSARSKQQYN